MSEAADPLLRPGVSYYTPERGFVQQGRRDFRRAEEFCRKLINTKPQKPGKLTLILTAAVYNQRKAEKWPGDPCFCVLP
jgi:hypothetical protein